MALTSASTQLSAADAGSLVFEGRGVSKRFDAVQALDDVSIELISGAVHALVGENGAGKSTLIKILTGAYQPDRGELRYLGEPVSFARPRDAQAAGISTIYQEINLVPLMSAAQNLFLGREPTNRLGIVDHRRMRREAREILGRYGLDVDVTRPLERLSIGVQQTVAVARAIEEKHRVVIMDEPTSSLEQREVERLFGIIQLLRGEGVAVLYVSHRLDEVYALCDRVTVLRDGRRVHDGLLAGLPRVALIGHMLGREITDAARVTTFAAESEHSDRDTVLTAHGLRRRFVLDGVDVTVRRGEVVGLAGLLGSGRSSTAKAIYGAQPLDSGSVAMQGRQVRRGSTRAAIAAGIALLPEDRKAEGIIPTLSVRDNITLAIVPRLARRGVLIATDEGRIARDLIARLHIKTSGPDQKVSDLSGGNQQKVLLARMLAMAPNLLILDDPTRGIDVGAKAEIQALVSQLAGEGLAVILISSDLEEVVEGSDTLLVLREGSVVGALHGAEISGHAVMALLASTGEDVPAAEVATQGKSLDD
ncbi:sugar ABC transporter ATP-binding protein [soil metagenome]